MIEQFMQPEGEDDKLDFSDGEEHVVVLYVETREEAEQYVALLADHDIEAIIGSEEEDDVPAELDEGIPVLVTANQLDEAGEIIADHEESGGFVLEEDQIEDIEEELDETEGMEELEVEGEDELLPLDDEEDDELDDELDDGEEDEYDPFAEEDDEV